MTVSALGNELGAPVPDVKLSGAYATWMLTGAFVLLFGTAPAAGQRFSLPHPNAKSQEGFTTITSARELADGRVLVSDPREGRLAVVDFKSGSIQSVGRKGEGPGEYPNAGPLRPLGADSSIMIEALSRRWLILDGDKIVRTLPPDETILPFQAIVVGVDTLGQVGLTLPPADAISSPGSVNVDSGRVVLWSRRNGLTTLVGKIAPAARPVDPKARTAWGSYDKAFHSKAGWTAIVRASPYRVDWIDPKGKAVLGRPIPYKPTRVDEAEKRAYMRSRAGDRKPEEPEAIGTWPGEVPPFNIAYPLLETATGELLVPRTPTSVTPNLTYDVVDRSGRLRRNVEMPPKTYLIAFGKGVAYSVSRDEDDLVYLQRHPWKP